MILSMTSARYDLLWTEVVIVTVLSFAVFASVGLLERAVSSLYTGSVPTDERAPSVLRVPEPAL